MRDEVFVCLVSQHFEVVERKRTVEDDPVESARAVEDLCKDGEGLVRGDDLLTIVCRVVDPVLFDLFS